MKKTLVVSALVLALLPLGAVYHKVGEITTPEPVQSVYGANGIAYVANGASGLRIMDVSDPADPVLCSVFPSNNAYLVTVYGSVAYLAEYYGLKFIDVQDPFEPSLLGTYNINLGTVRSITVAGSHLYAATNGGLLIIDVSDPQNPVLDCTYDLQAKSITIIENIAYAICWESGEWTVMKIFDVSDPQNPDELASYDVNLAINSFAVDGSTAFIVAYHSFLQLIDISNPLQPTLLSTFTPPVGVYSVAVEDDVAFLAIGDRELYALDVSDPQAPTLLTNYDTFHGSAQNITVANHIAYMGNGSSTLHLIDVSNPQNLALLGYYPTPQIACSVVVQGNTAYVAEFNFGLRIIDISNPANPILLGSYGPIWNANYVTVEAGIAYVGGAGLTILDISDPQNPAFLGEMFGTHAMYSCYVDDQIAYDTALGFDTVHLGITDVSDPQNPVWLGGMMDPPGNVVTVYGSIAYFISGSSLTLIDVSDPSNLILLGSWDALEGISSVAVAGNVVYATTTTDLYVIDISNPSTLFQVGSYPLHDSSDINYSYIHGNRLYVSDNGWNEISTYDISTPQTPVLIARYAWNLSMERGMCIDTGRLYTPNGGYGLHIHNLTAVDVDDAVQITLSFFQLSNYPNPFNPETTISYTLPTAGLVSLEVYNSRGQLVRCLLQEEQSAGEHILIWNGRDDFGNNVASGLYLCRIVCNGKEETRKLLLIK